MKYCITLILALISSTIFAQNTALWQDYFSYNDIRSIDATNTKTIYATDNSIIVYDDATKEQTIFNTVTGLRLDDIQTIKYSQERNKIIAGNKLGNIALINLNDGKISYLNVIRNKPSLSDTEKIINKIVIKDNIAYVATGYGISEVLLNQNEFGDSYFVGNNGANRNIKDLEINGNNLVALVEGEGIKSAELQSNLIDFSQWNLVNNINWDEIVFINNQLYAYTSNELYKIDNQNFQFLFNMNVNIREIIPYENLITFVFQNSVQVLNANFQTVYNLSANADFNEFSTGLAKNNQYIIGSHTFGLKNVSTGQILSPNGPYSNNIFKMKNSPSNDLWMVYGGFDNNFNPYYPPYGLKSEPYSVRTNNTWHTVKFNKFNARAIANIFFDPKDKTVAYISSYYDGLLKVSNVGANPDNYQYTLYNQNNGIPYITADNSVRVLGPVFDSNGIGWFTSSLAPQPLVKMTRNFTFQGYSVGLANNVFLPPVIDKNQTKWLPTLYSGLIAFNETNNKTIAINTESSSLPTNQIKVAALDLNDQLWIGTYGGLRIVPNINQFMTSNSVNVSNIVILDNGTPEELFYQQTILDILVDGSNNKWISVADSGVFYISANGQETIYHFDTSNSPLPSDNIHSIGLNAETGEIFFASSKGLVSFTNVISTVASENLENVYAFPNPVRPEFEGDVKITGLMENSNVKIADSAGNLVFETSSLGGTVLWNTTNFAGQKVPSGIYIIFASSNDGVERALGKIAIVR